MDTDLEKYFSLWLANLECRTDEHFKALEKVLRERDARYDERFKAQEVAVSAAFQAQKELNRVISDSSEKAIVKAETAQHDYNERSNEFRGALDDQGKRMSETMLPRLEYNSAHAALISKMDDFKKQVDERFEGLRRELTILQESKSKIEGRAVEKVETRQQTQWGTGTVLMIVVFVLGFLFNIVTFVINYIK